MATSNQQFAKELEDMVSSRRAFWDHPFIQKFRSAELTKDQVRHWIEQQFYLTGRVHDLFGPLYAKCEDARIRMGLVHNLLEEETGEVSHSAPHPELYIRLGEALGSSREAMRSVKPIPEALGLRSYWTWIVKERPFVEGVAAISIAGEAQVPGAGFEFSRILEQKYGLTHEQTAFWWVHEEADKEHGGGAIEMVTNLAQTDQERENVRRTVDDSLTMLWRFFDGLELSCGHRMKAA
jgi:pyrroloquinoline-quinone synthase